MLLLAPAVVVLAVLAIAPLALVLRDSVAHADVYGGVTGGFTLDNYRQLLDPVYLTVLRYSLGVAALNTALCLTLGYLTAAYVVSRPPRAQGRLLLLLVLPFWTDFMVRTFAWITLLGDSGPIVRLLRALGLVEGTTSWVPSGTAVVLGLVYAFLPTAVFPIYASMRSVDGSVLEAAADLGCSWWQTQRRVVLPLCRSGLAGATVLTFVPTLGVFVIPVLLGGGKSQLVGNLVVTLYTEFRNQPAGAAAAVVLLVLMLSVLALMPALGALSRRRSR